VEQGTLYRSGQLSAAQLDRAIGTYGLKTVVNLRGPDPDRRWYRDQQDVCQKHGVKQVDIALGTQNPSPQEVETLLATYREAPRPILIHSWSSQGSVGLASAMYRVSVLGEDKERASKELAPWTSYRWPIPALAGQDRFLREWGGPEGSVAEIRTPAGGASPLPDPMFDRVGDSMVSRPGAAYRSSGSDGSLPPPAIEYFRGEGSLPAPAGPARSAAHVRGEIQPVVWLGAPEGLQ
jgi:protein tyrosine phosphatase (PTP) superfamily phosphohydrolase (DUF442 family)